MLRAESTRVLNSALPSLGSPGPCPGTDVLQPLNQRPEQPTLPWGSQEGITEKVTSIWALKDA